MIPTDVHTLRHGYSLADLDQMTRAAVIADRIMAADIRTRRDIAWSAIAEYLYASEQPPERGQLIRVGWQAIYREARDTWRQHGYPDEKWRDYDVHLRPRFAMYWADFAVTPSPEHRVVEGLVVWHVLAVLRPVYRDALVALAVHDDYRDAARALGITGSALRSRITVARREILARWFEGETPHRTRRIDRRVGAYDKPLNTHCSNGHEWTPENTRISRIRRRGKRVQRRVCRSCEHDRRNAKERAE